MKVNFNEEGRYVHFDDNGAYSEADGQAVCPNDNQYARHVVL